MPLSVARCGNFFLHVVLLGLATQAHAQADPRDALIEDLRRRIDALEKRVDDPPAPPKPAPAPPAKPPAEESAEKDESSRALERTLVREGGLVLPAGVVEVEPRLQYTYRGSDALSIVTLGGATQIATQDVKRDALEASVAVSVGLPWQSQVELRLPYVWLEEDRAIGGTQSVSEGESGAGDIEFTLSKQLLAERSGRPSLLASLNWKSVSGSHDLGRLSAGSGFHQLQAALTGVKRQDPLVFFTSLSYIAILERTRGGSDVDPGDGIGLKAGGLLAASPETSLRAGFELNRLGRTRVGGVAVPGSDATAALLELGIASLLSSRMLLDVQLSVGITPDAPDFQLRLALPIRF